MKRAAIIGKFKAIKDNFIFVNQKHYCFIYPLSEIREIRCLAWGKRAIDYSKNFEAILKGKQVKLTFKED